MTGRLYTGVFRAGSDAHYLWVGQDWTSFQAKWTELADHNLRLIDLKVDTSGTHPTYSGVWREGSDAHYLWVGVDWASFHAKWEELSTKNLRLVDIEIYKDGSQTKYAGVWRAGSDAHYLWVGVDWASFHAKWEELSKKNLRLIDIEVYHDGGQTKYAGVWREGNDAHYLWVGVDWASFQAKWEELSKQKLRLADIEVYTDGGQTKYAGVWREGNDAHYLWAGVDWENFLAKWHELSAKNLRLTSLEIMKGQCSDECVGQVLMPDNPSTKGRETYNYGITATALHCKGLPGSEGVPAQGARVYYRWPCVTFDGSQPYVRLSALYFEGTGPLTIPFKDPAVQRGGTWLYSPGSWHHALDFSRSDGHSFDVVAAAAGRVIHVGWDNWSGNTIVVSHDANGVKDAFRTIYMHLRNGAMHDANAAWNITVPTLGEPLQSQYKTFLSKTGCPHNGPRHPDPKYWGTDAEVIDSKLLDKTVAAGQVLARAGETGPGGCHATDPDPTYVWNGHVNTHLHLFVARRDPTDGEWYFLDPYGIYGPPSCYPAELTDPVSSPCRRYPSAWKGGHPQYP